MNCPLPRYWMCHALIALVIAAVIAPVLGPYAGLAAGMAFYVGREYTQWESGLAFDWWGFAAPVVVCLIVMGLIAWL